MSSSNRDFFDCMEYLFDYESWYRRMMQHGVKATLKAAAEVKARISQLESLGYVFEPPFCEDAFPCLT
jgi:hypothetical protein